MMNLSLSELVYIICPKRNDEAVLIRIDVHYLPQTNAKYVTGFVVLHNKNK